MNRITRLSRWYWLITGTVLAAALFGAPLGFAPVFGLTVAHNLHYFVREGSIKAFPVQVRVGYLAWMLKEFFSWEKDHCFPLTANISYSLSFIFMASADNISSSERGVPLISAENSRHDCSCK